MTATGEKQQSAHLKMKPAKKTFELSSLKKYKRYEKMLRIIPLIWAVIGFKELFLDNLQFAADNASIANVVLFYLSAVTLLSAIPFFIGTIIIRTRIKSVIRNCTIPGMQEFDYYRENLTGISPAAISLLTNLDIEQEKDIAASILQYENLGILAKDHDNTYHTTPKYELCTVLNESDRYLIQHIIAGDFNWESDAEWKQLVIREAIAEGYIEKKEPLWTKTASYENEPQPKSAKVKIRLIKLLLIAVWLFWVISACPRMIKLNAFFTIQPGRSLAEHFSLFNSQPELILEFVESLAMFFSLMLIIGLKPRRKANGGTASKKERIIPAIVFLVWIMWIFSAFPTLLSFDMGILKEPERLFRSPEQMTAFLSLMPLLVFSVFMLSCIFSAPHLLGIMTAAMKSIQRTEYGNHMAECIYGMKNFIHDYSNLSEADRRHAALWEDYLVYAVVLEENESIVNEIAAERRA